MDCSKSSKGKCKRHEQSPIHLLQNTTRKCIDRHLMRYFAGECQLEDMDFQILPHSLRVYQPENDCSGKYQPGIDFSRGYPNPWQVRAATTAERVDNSHCFLTTLSLFIAFFYRHQHSIAAYD